MPPSLYDLADIEMARNVLYDISSVIKHEMSRRSLTAVQISQEISLMADDFVNSTTIEHIINYGPASDTLRAGLTMLNWLAESMQRPAAH